MTSWLTNWLLWSARTHTHTSTDPSWLTMSSMIMLTSSHGARWCTVRIPNQTSKPQNPSTGCGLAVGAPTYSSAYVYSFTSHFTSHLGWIKTYYGIPWHMGGWTSISLNSLILGETDAVSFFLLKMTMTGGSNIQSDFRTDPSIHGLWSFCRHSPKTPTMWGPRTIAKLFYISHNYWDVVDVTWYNMI
jgi:hypothetical protein